MANREYKDTIFRHLLSVCNKSNEYFLDVFNALFCTNLTTESANILDVSLDASYYTKLRNDVAKVVNGKLVVLLEHQATVNENMPLRFLQYIAATYSKILDSKDKYRECLIKIPTPVFIVFYNGQKDYPVESTQQLSDAFIGTGGMLELTVKVININFDKGADILQKSFVLRDYSELCNYIAEFRKQGCDDYVQKGVSKAIEKGVLSDYLQQNNKEIIDMFFSEYDYDTDIAVKQEESWNKGMERGMQQGIYQGVLQQKEKDDIIIAQLRKQIEVLKQGK